MLTYHSEHRETGSMRPPKKGGILLYRLVAVCRKASCIRPSIKLIRAYNNRYKNPSRSAWVAFLHATDGRAAMPRHNNAA